MLRTLLFVIATALGGAAAVAQEIPAGAGRVEIGAFPAGGIFFMAGGNDAQQPDFGNYALGASLAVNVNRFVGIEGEIGGGIGVKQELTFGQQTLSGQSTPHMLAYNGSVVVHPGGNDRAVVPYAVGGVGGLTMFNRPDVMALGVTSDATYLTGNVGAGLKWFAGNHWGLRADYRFFAIQNKDTAPLFFGQTDNRYGHRIYGGLLLTY